MKRAVKSLAIVTAFVGLIGVLRADEETKGTIKSVDANRMEVVLKGIVENSTYVLNKNATVWVDGARAKFSDLVPDDRVVIDYKKTGDRLMATQIRALRKDQETTGTLADVLVEKQEITIKGTIKNETYLLSKSGTVWVDGKTAKLGDIRPGDQVLVTYSRRGDRLVADDVTLLKRK